MSEVRANTISDAAGTGPVTLTKQKAAKLHSRVSYSGGTPSTTEGFNISSIVDTAVGLVTNNYTSALSSANYAVAVTAYVGSRVGSLSSSGAPTTTSCVTSVTLSNTAAEVDVDRALICTGDLA